MAYTQKQLEKIRKELEAEIRRLHEESSVIEHRAAGADETDAVHELADYDENHPGDLGTETFEREKDLALSENVGALIAKVERAVEKVNEGTYGACDRCGAEIPSERLRILPYASMCVRCQDAVEGR